MDSRNYDERVEQKLKELQNEDSIIRLSATAFFREFPDARSVDLLLSLILNKNEDERIWHNALIALERIKDPKAVEPLIGLLKNSTEKERDWIISVLGLIGDKGAVEPLIEALKDEKVAGTAARALMDIGDKRAIEPLWNLLNSDPQGLVGADTAQALAKLGDKGVLPWLYKALENKSYSSYYARLHAVQALGSLGDKQAVEPLIEALSDQRRSVACSAARALAKLGDLRAIKPLVTLLKTEDVELIRDAALALGELNDASAMVALKETLKNPILETDVWAKVCVLGALYKLGDEEVLDPLLETLDSSGWERGVVLDYLGSTRDEQVSARCINLLEDEDFDVRRAAVEALKNIGDKQALPALEKLEQEVTGKILWLREAATEAIEHIKSLNQPIEVQ